jgi:hypothetical protein
MRFDKEARDFVILTEVCLYVVEVFLHERKTDDGQTRTDTKSQDSRRDLGQTVSFWRVHVIVLNNFDKLKRLKHFPYGRSLLG